MNGEEQGRPSALNRCAGFPALLQTVSLSPDQRVQRVQHSAGPCNPGLFSGFQECRPEMKTWTQVALKSQKNLTCDLTWTWTLETREHV